VPSPTQGFAPGCECTPKHSRLPRGYIIPSASRQVQPKPPCAGAAPRTVSANLRFKRPWRGGRRAGRTATMRAAAVKILLVQGGLGDSVGLLLEHCGYRAVWVQTTNQALERMMSKKPHARPQLNAGVRLPDTHLGHIRERGPIRRPIAPLAWPPLSRPSVSAPPWSSGACSTPRIACPTRIVPAPLLAQAVAR